LIEFTVASSLEWL